MNRQAQASARAIAARQPDYRVARADEVYEGDGLRLVPSYEHPVPIDLCCPLVVVAVSREAGLTAIKVSERAEMVHQVLYGVSAPTHTTVLYDDDYPVLVR